MKFEPTNTRCLLVYQSATGNQLKEAIKYFEYELNIFMTKDNFIWKSRQKPSLCLGVVKMKNSNLTIP